MSMGLPAGLDTDLLRAFAYIAEEGSFTRAAARVGRTQSAVSMQVQRLEGLLGQKVLERGKGGSVRLTPHGQYLLDRSRDMLALNDEIWRTFRTPQMHGTVRFGLPDDYALPYLPMILKRFADTHPAVEVEVLCAPSDDVADKLKSGDLDLGLVTNGHEPRGWAAQELWRGNLMWVTSERYAPHRIDPLPLALSGGGCSWCVAAPTALERAGRRYRIAYRSATLLGTHAPVMAGLAVTVSALTWLPEGLRALRPDEGLPELPECSILLLKAEQPRQPVTDVFATHVAETFCTISTQANAGARLRS